MNKDIIIKIATDFSRIPGARYPEEGDYSGQEFRQNVLHPALKKAIEMNVKLIVDLYNRANELYTFHKRNVQKNVFFRSMENPV